MGQVSIAPVPASWYGFAVSQTRPKTIEAEYWALAEAPGGVRIELAGLSPMDDWQAWIARTFELPEGAQRLAVKDSASGRESYAFFDGDQLVLALYVAAEPVLVSRQWAAGLLAEAPERLRRSDILAGRPGGDRPDPGQIICSCNSVGINTILRAVQVDGCGTVEAVGVATSAGTNCGSCRAEIRAIIAAQRVAAE